MMGGPAAAWGRAGPPGSEQTRMLIDRAAGGRAPIARGADRRGREAATRCHSKVLRSNGCPSRISVTGNLARRMRRANRRSTRVLAVADRRGRESRVTSLLCGTSTAANR